MKKYFCLALLMIGFTGFSQDSVHDVHFITATIENYFNGYIERDSVQLYRAFDHVNGVMKVTSKTKEGKEIVENIYFKELLPKWSGREKLPQSVLDNSELKILNIDVAESKIGSAKIFMKVGDDVYIDILSLQKINGEWKITNKIFLTISN